MFLETLCIILFCSSVRESFINVFEFSNITGQLLSVSSGIVYNILMRHFRAEEEPQGQ